MHTYITNQRRIFARRRCRRRRRTASVVVQQFSRSISLCRGESGYKYFSACICVQNVSICVHIIFVKIPQLGLRRAKCGVIVIAPSTPQRATAVRSIRSTFKSCKIREIFRCERTRAWPPFLRLSLFMCVCEVCLLCFRIWITHRRMHRYVVYCGA